MLKDDGDVQGVTQVLLVLWFLILMAGVRVWDNFFFFSIVAKN